MDIGKIRLGLIAIIVLAGIYTIYSTSIYTFKSDDMGLVSRFPIFYWIGLGAIGLFFYLNRKSIQFTTFSFIFLCFYLYVIPGIIREPVWLSNSYYPYSESINLQDIENNISNINLSKTTDISTSYYYWPLFLFLSSIINITTAINSEFLLKFFPVLTILLIASVSYLIFRLKFNDVDSIIGASLVISSFWLRQQYFGPPGISFIFFFFIFYIVSFLLLKPFEFKKEYFIILIGFCFTILFSHLLTTAIIVFILGSLFILNIFVKIKNYRPLFIITVISGLGFLGYYFRSYILPFDTGGLSNNYIQWIINTLINSITNITKLSIIKEPSRIQATLAGMVSYYSSWLIVLLNGVFILYLFISYIIKHQDTRKIISEAYSLFLILFMGCLGFMAFALTYGPHESYQRAFMFGILPLTYFILISIHNNKKILYTVLLMIFILNIPAQYGSDGFRTATADLMYGNKFFSDYISDSKTATCINDFSLYSRYYHPEKRFKFTVIDYLPFTSYPSKELVQLKYEQSDYVMLSNEEENYYHYYLGKDPNSQVDLDSNLNTLDTHGEFYSNRIYSGNGFELYRIYTIYNQLTTGYEPGDETWHGATVTPGCTTSVSSLHHYEGSYAGLYTTSGSTSTTVAENAYNTVNVDEDDVYARGYFYVDSGLPLANDGDRFYFLRFRGADGTTTLASAGIRRNGGVTSWILIYRSGSTLYGPVYSSVPVVDGWHSVELHLLHHATGGIVEMWVDGELIDSKIGIDSEKLDKLTYIDVGIVSADYDEKLIVYSDSIVISNDRIR